VIRVIQGLRIFYAGSRNAPNGQPAAGGLGMRSAPRRIESSNSPPNGSTCQLANALIGVVLVNVTPPTARTNAATSCVSRAERDIFLQGEGRARKYLADPERSARGNRAK